ncbi:SulP family inorganic anion transporter [Litorimonas haliclonae]|uniref:SulP family inorganic anion transporter n=1 Tax=Litorimonas haliclonae TaxID=2081977 RepID=UPI0039F130A0
MALLGNRAGKPPIFDFSNIRGDIYGGVTAGIVALPLALAFGAGVFPPGVEGGAIAGLWGAIIVGFFAALFGGTNTQISGPTGPMVVVFAGLLASLVATMDPSMTIEEQVLSAIPLLFAAVVLGGIIQILAGVFKLGKYIKLVPYPVISGFMSGIGVIIILLQFSRLFGGAPEGGTVFSAIEAIPVAISNINYSALGLAALTLATVFLWPKKLSKFLPGTLAALIVGTLAGLLLTNVPILGAIPSGIPDFVLPQLSGSTLVIVLEAAVILAVLGAIDSLLTSLVADNVTRTRHNSDQELIGQGVGNTIAGFFGALPGAGATMRTMVNIRTGGSTKISGMVHGLVLLAIVLVLSPLAAKIPHAVLAGILVKVGYDIIDFSYIRSALRGPRFDYVIMMLVLLVTVFVDLITAVGLGVVLAALAFVWRTADDQLKEASKVLPRTTTAEERKILEESDGRISMFDFGGAMSFSAAADLGHHVRQGIPEGSGAIVLDFSRLPFVDVSAARAIETIAVDAKAAGKRVYTSGISPEVMKKLKGLRIDEALDPNYAFEDRLTALRHAAEQVGSKPKGGTPAQGGDAPLPA